jgi:hypothetical protein
MVWYYIFLAIIGNLLGAICAVIRMIAYPLYIANKSVELILGIFCLPAEIFPFEWRKFNIPHMLKMYKKNITREPNSYSKLTGRRRLMLKGRFYER